MASSLEESHYNSLGHRFRSLADTDEDGDIDGQDNTTTPAAANGSDYWTDMVYDDSWRIVATFSAGDAAASPRERFVYHCAGMDGKGSSLGGVSCIDAIVLRERSDATPRTSTTGAWQLPLATNFGSGRPVLLNPLHAASLTSQSRGPWHFRSVPRFRQEAHSMGRSSIGLIHNTKLGTM